MMYYEWIVTALGIIVAYMLLGLLWAWWTQRHDTDHEDRE